MSKKSKRYLSFILSMSLMFTSLFTGVVFAEEKAADSLESYIAQFEENPVTTQSAITYNLEIQVLRWRDPHRKRRGCG